MGTKYKIIDLVFEGYGFDGSLAGGLVVLPSRTKSLHLW